MRPSEPASRPGTTHLTSDQLVGCMNVLHSTLKDKQKKYQPKCLENVSLSINLMDGQKMEIRGEV